MKAKLMVVIGSLAIIAASSSFSYPCSGCGCPPPYGCHTASSGCSQSPYPSCTCTDPACGDDDSSCMGQGRCCEAFGNMGV